MTVRLICGMSGRGIINTADDGPTTAVINSKPDVDKMKAALRRALKAGLKMAEKKSSDHK